MQHRRPSFGDQRCRFLQAIKTPFDVAETKAMASVASGEASERVFDVEDGGRY